MAVEQFSNAPQTTITEDLTDVETDVDVASFAGFPAAAQYRILIESELMLVTAGAGTGTWTVTRGVEGTANVGHNSGATVTHVLTAGAIGQMRNDNVATTAYASIPAAGMAGRVFLPSDGLALQRDTGAAWVPWGPIFPLATPPTTGWSWDNQGDASVDEAYGGIYLTKPAVAAASLRVRYLTAPTVPYTITACILPHVYKCNYPIVGLCFRESASGKLAAFGFGRGADAIQRQDFTDSTHYSAESTQVPIEQLSGALWMQIADNNTNRIMSWSADGVHWYAHYTVGRTSFLTADQVGIFANPQNVTYPAGMTLVSWKEA
jgi:hypothetical protein